LLSKIRPTKNYFSDNDFIISTYYIFGNGFKVREKRKQTGLNFDFILKVAMNILNNGRFGMVAGLSGIIKMAIRSFY